VAFVNLFKSLFRTKAKATPSSVLGAAGEKIAVQHLQRMGCRIVERNWRSRLGEVDVICVDGEALVFVEVKAAKHLSALPPEVRVNRHKQHKLLTLAEHYLKVNHTDRPVRFDVISVWSENGTPQIRHVKDAFSTR
jgi:putative endonuclease